jgi:hypothetical protein
LLFKSYLQTQADVTFEQVALLVHLALVHDVQVAFFTAFLAGTLPSANTLAHANNATATPNPNFFIFIFL